MDELSQSASPTLPVDERFGLAGAGAPAQVVLPADGRFAGSYHQYIVIPDGLLTVVVEHTEAEPAAFGSFAAMGPFGSFELRRSDVPTATALTTWPGTIDFYYANDRHFAPILARMGIPVIPLKRDFLQAYERVITELGQL